MKKATLNRVKVFVDGGGVKAYYSWYLKTKADEPSYIMVKDQASSGRLIDTRQVKTRKPLC